MVLSISAVILLGVFVYLLWRYAGLSAWQAAICIVFGYLLSSTSVGPHIADALRAASRWISSLHI